jgi:hypothetical protein
MPAVSSRSNFSSFKSTSCTTSASVRSLVLQGEGTHLLVSESVHEPRRAEGRVAAALPDLAQHPLEVLGGFVRVGQEIDRVLERTRGAPEAATRRRCDLREEIDGAAKK